MCLSRDGGRIVAGDILWTKKNNSSTVYCISFFLQNITFPRATISPRPKHYSSLNISAEAGLKTKTGVNSVWLPNSKLISICRTSDVSRIEFRIDQIPRLKLF